MDRAIMIGLRWFVVAATVTGGFAWFLNWLVIAAASVTLIDTCLEAASLAVAGAAFRCPVSPIEPSSPAERYYASRQMERNDHATLPSPRLGPS